MLPLTFLATMLALTGCAVVVNASVRGRRAACLGRLAAGWQMKYIGHDPFHLLQKISRNFPVPGAADLVVTDVIYGSEPGRHRYLFTVQYTQGVIRTKSRLRRVATFSEPRDQEGGGLSPLQLAPAELPLVEQYGQLRAMLAGGDEEMQNAK